MVAVTHVDPESHATVGVEVIDVDVVESVTLPVVNVVEVALMLQPAPDPVASPTSSAWFAVTVWLSPFSVAVKVTFGGALTKASEPPVTVAVAVAAPAGAAGSSQARHSIAAAPIAIALRWVRTTKPSIPPGNGGQVGGKGQNLRNHPTVPTALPGLGDPGPHRSAREGRQGGPAGRRKYPETKRAEGDGTDGYRNRW